MGLFKKRAVQDERVVNMKNKIYAELYILILVICAASVVIKRFVYEPGFEHISTELTILIAGGLYYTYRSAKLGVFSAEVELHDRQSKWSMQKKNLVMSIGLGVVIALAFGINSAVQYAEGFAQSVYYFLLTAFGSLMIYLPVFIMLLVVGSELAKRKSEREIDKMLGDDDEKY
ncbi:DUF6773 family protein [Lentibacillus saliphilus]|uniref:DUF6773 family protein n=1 Tax=Lentibacillus saliphilus TaxID=2737028 RepID=UPI001C3114F0|nr:DUF6773 family protein [Lentibacillus saliphilus]